MPDVIHFYAPGGAYGCFSNHSAHPIVLHGKTWPTTEHYFQARKLPGTDHEEAIRREPSSTRAAELG
ncbi:MAG: NADAR family protein, partial [Pedosphaera parvula]|nr:NADAR family protein [Pedosphaera parvula]